MTDPPTTRASLLLRLRDPRDGQAWEEFVAIYAPLIDRLARAQGLQAADAADLSQDVFRAVAAAIDRFDPDPARGSFRGWLARITRNLMVNLLIARARHPQGSGDSRVLDWLDQQPAPDARETLLFDAEHRARLFRWAADQVRGEFRDSTWRAFWLTAVDGLEPRAAAEALGLSPGAVYIARSRVIARLRQVVEPFQKDGHEPIVPGDPS
jgi:RNA polymerase sigma-70 factor (ECF subfamily)